MTERKLKVNWTPEMAADLVAYHTKDEIRQLVGLNVHIAARYQGEHVSGSEPLCKIGSAWNLIHSVEDYDPGLSFGPAPTCEPCLLLKLQYDMENQGQQ